MKKNLLILIIFFMPFNSFSQGIHYGYDLAGNRIARVFVPMRIAMDSTGTGEEFMYY